MFKILKSLKNLISLLGKYRKHVYSGCIIALFESSMAFVPFALLFYVIKVGIERPFEMKDFYFVFGIMVAGVLLRALFKRLQDSLQQDKGYYAFSENRLDLTNHLSKLNMGYYTDTYIGNITSVVTTDITFIEEYAIAQLGLATSSLASIVPSVIFLFLFDYRLCILYVLLMIVAMWGLDISLRAMNRNSRTRQDNLGNLSNSVLNFVKGMQTIKAFNMQKEKTSLLEKDIETTKEGSIHFVKDVGLANFIFYILSNLPTGIMIVVVSYLMINSGFSLAYGLGFIVFSFVMFLPVTILGTSAEIFSVTDAAVDRFSEIMNEKEIFNSEKNVALEKMNISFKNVTFAYENKEVLKNINLDFNDKTFTALVGKSGSGKTTIANLIARFWDVEKGEITIDGHNIKDISIENLLDSISMVFQRVYLFNDTIFNNIAFGNKKATKDDVIKAAKKARCHDFIMKLENGYDTIIGEGGSTLSGGEKQRISIARAILKDAKLILLDEATAGIDPENEKFILEAIDELVKNKTLIVIAHRLSTIQKADNIVYLEDGEIKEMGTHDELLEKNGRYKKQFDFYTKMKE